MKSQLHEIKIHPAEGGVHMQVTHKVKRGGQGGGPLHEYEDGKPSVHTSRESLHAALNEHLGSVFGQDADRATADGKEHEPE